MPTNLEFLEQPEQGDRGNVFCPLIERNFDKLDQHVHDGITSNPIEVKHVVKGTVSISAAAWATVTGTSLFIQTVNLPAGFLMATSVITAKIGNGADDGSIVLPTIEPVSTVAFSVTCNDNSLDMDFLIQ